MNTIYLTAFVLGLTSNLHCLGMCGPIALSLPVKSNKLGTSVFYNSGRILTYGLFGILTGLIGMSVTTLGAMQWVSILIGTGMILYAWRMYLPSFDKWNFSFTQHLVQVMSKVMRTRGFLKFFFLGILNGLLPCGMVYLALLNSILCESPIQGFFSMIAFGAGTLPVMLSVHYFSSKITPFFRKRLLNWVPLILTITGVLVIVRGSNLGIPYLSPKISVKTEKQRSSLPVEINCCSKPAEK